MLRAYADCQAATRLGPPDRSMVREPVKVFDNLYFVGQSEYSAWAVTTTEGIILIDTLFDYSVEEEVAGGLKKLGLDPTTIRYAVVTHLHPTTMAARSSFRIAIAHVS